MLIKQCLLISLPPFHQQPMDFFFSFFFFNFLFHFHCFLFVNVSFSRARRAIAATEVVTASLFLGHYFDLSKWMPRVRKPPFVCSRIIDKYYHQGNTSLGARFTIPTSAFQQFQTFYVCFIIANIFGNSVFYLSQIFLTLFVRILLEIVGVVAKIKRFDEFAHISLFAANTYIFKMIDFRQNSTFCSPEIGSIRGCSSSSKIQFAYFGQKLHAPITPTGHLSEIE